MSTHVTNWCSKYSKKFEIDIKALTDTQDLLETNREVIKMEIFNSLIFVFTTLGEFPSFR